LPNTLTKPEQPEGEHGIIIDNIPVLAWYCLPDGTTEFLNRRWLDYTGLSLKEALGWGWTSAVHPVDREKLVATWRALIDSGEPGEESARLRRFDGEYRWFLFRVVPARDEAGAIVRWYGTNTEIEDLHRAQALIATEKKTMEMIGSGLSLQATLENLCDTIDAQSPKIVSAVLLMDTDGRHLRPVAGKRLPRAWLDAINPVAVGPLVNSTGTTAFPDKAVIVSDIASDPRWVNLRQVALANGLRAVWSQPLVLRNSEVAGAFCLYYRELRTPDPSDLQLMESSGRIAVLAIEGDRAQAALTKATSELRKSEAQLRKTIDNIPGFISIMSPEGEIELVNQQTLDYLGMTLDQIRNWSAVLHEDDREAVISTWKRSGETGEPYDMQHRIRRADGVYRWFHVRGLAVRDPEGSISRWYILVTDIDEQKRAEERVRQDDTELRRMTDAIPTFIQVLNPDGTVLYANETVLNYLGLTLAEVQRQNSRSRIFHPEDVERLREERGKALALDVPFENEQRVLGKNGKYRWFLICYNPLRNEQGKVIRWYATGTDINDRKKAEERMRNENLELREEIDRSSMFEEIVGFSDILRRALTQVSRVAPTESTVLILGETGTGKELIARAIHKRSKRSGRAFVRVNCAAIPTSLIAAELFGHEKGAFTGAVQRRAGRFEAADGGTIFLDEIGDLPPETQIALLRVLQEKEIERVGSNRPVPVDVRVITATNRDLQAAVASGTFRQDLFFRLNVFPIQVPPLRERKDDIPLLVEYLVDRYAKKTGKRLTTIHEETLNLFQAYDWPGNIRELQNVIERAVILCDGDTFEVEESWLKPELPRRDSHETLSLSTIVTKEKEIIETVLKETRGRVSGPNGAAARLGIPRQTLESKIKTLGIDKFRFKTNHS
jgi:formate hydrogenlyase transcriptional activator